jgi:hypothetical protein
MRTLTRSLIRKLIRTHTKKVIVSLMRTLRRKFTRNLIRKLIKEAHLVLTVGIETRSLKLVRAERSVWINIHGVDTRHSWESRPLDKARRTRT